MKSARPRTEVEVLIREIQRYLAFVEALRRSGPGRKGSGGKGAASRRG